MSQLTLLEKKKQRLEQQKNRIKNQEASLKILERKQRTRQLIEVGGLIVKTELDKLPSNVLLGILLEAKSKLKADGALKDKWAKLGGNEFEKETKNKTTVIVTFPEKPTATTRQTIRELGLKWNNTRKEWHGLVPIAELKSTLANENAHIQKMDTI